MDILDAKVRAFDLADMEDVLAIYRQPGVILQTLQVPHRSPEEIRESLRAPRRGLRQLVAEIEEEGGRKVVGLLGLEQLPGRRAHTGSIGMFVHDRYQGRGIGTRLLEEAIRLGERWLGLTRLELTVYVDNAAAIHLYEKLGFEVEGRLRRYALRDGEWVDSFAMARLLPQEP